METKRMAQEKETMAIRVRYKEKIEIKNRNGEVETNNWEAKQ